MQSTLEIRAIEARDEQKVLNDYSKENVYKLRHPDAVSDGDTKGKGFGVSHGHTVPDPTKSPKMYDYSNIPTYGGGDSYDIYGRGDIEGGRQYLEAISLYGKNREYGPHLIDTKGNANQYRVLDPIN